MFSIATARFAAIVASRWTSFSEKANSRSLLSNEITPMTCSGVMIGTEMEDLTGMLFVRMTLSLDASSIQFSRMISGFLINMIFVVIPSPNRMGWFLRGFPSS